MEETKLDVKVKEKLKKARKLIRIAEKTLSSIDLRTLKTVPQVKKDIKNIINGLSDDSGVLTLIIRYR